MTAKIVSINISLPEEVRFGKQTVRTAICKRPVSGPVRVGKMGLEGDGQANLAVHGGSHKAVYAYSHEDYAWWAENLQREDLSFGHFGENLTISGLDQDEISIGDELRIGSCLLAVTGPRIPCAMLGLRFNDSHMPRRFTEAARPGCYFRVIDSGAIETGESLEIFRREKNSVKLKQMFRAYSNPRSDAAITLLEKALTVPGLDPAFIPNIQKRLRANKTESNE
jgi:MOSC domain-containing protein YiiM